MHVISKVRPLQVRKSDCYRVLTRNLRSYPAHGRWEPISTSGFMVVCPSRLEACELVYQVGQVLYPRPERLIHGDDHDDIRYLDWLLEHFFRVEPHHAGGPLEVMYSEFKRGWFPNAEEILAGRTITAQVRDGRDPETTPRGSLTPQAGEMISDTLRRRWTGS